MKRFAYILLCCVLLVSLLLPTAVFAVEEATEDTPWSTEYSRIMDITDSLSAVEIRSLDEGSMDFLRTFHLDFSIAAIPEARLEGCDAATFAAELYESCGFGYGDTKDGFSCLYLEDAEQLTIVAIGGAEGVLPQTYLDFVEEHAPTMREEYGVFGVFYGCQAFLKDGMESYAQQPTTETEPETVTPTELETIVPTESEPVTDFARCGEGSSLPAWFPADLDEAFVYFDANAPRVVDYADILSDETEAALTARIAEITAETGKDIVIVTDVSSYGLGEDIYAADFYDYNGYGIGDEHEGILLFINMDPADRGGWTVETGAETRGLLTQDVADRLDDFLYDTLASGNYALAFSEWVEDVYDIFTVGIARAPFWYCTDGSLPDDYRNPDAPVVVDEWRLLTEEQISTLEERSEAIKEAYGVNVYFHTTRDQLGLYAEEYNDRYMACMGYEKDAILIAIENTNGYTEQYSYIHLYGTAKDLIASKYLTRLENGASVASDGYGRLYKGQELLSVFLKHGRVPRTNFYWVLMAGLAALIGYLVGRICLSKAKSSMKTVSKQTSANPYLDRKNTVVKRVRETFLYKHTKRTYVPPRTTSSSSSTRSSSSHSSYRSSYSGHSGTSHSGHGRKF